MLRSVGLGPCCVALANHSHAFTHVPPQPAGSLVAKCRTLDQARAVVTFLDAASEKTLRATVALTASRGRGKVGVACVRWCASAFASF